MNENETNTSPEKPKREWLIIAKAVGNYVLDVLPVALGILLVIAMVLYFA